MIVRAQVPEVFEGQWSNGTVMPGTTYLGSGTSYTTTVGDATNGYVFSIGGNTSSGLREQCWKYDVDADTWTPIASLPSGRVVLASATVGDFVYAIGGSDGTTYQNTVYKYDITLDTWSTVASLPALVGWGKAVGYNNKIYLVGGYNTTYLSSVYVYDVGTDIWSTATSIPSGRFGGALSITGNTLVYVGGANSLGITDEVLTGVIDGTDPLLITWTTVASRYPGIGKETFTNHVANPDAFLRNAVSKEKSNIAAAYPPGSMYRFDAAPWGTDGIIVAGGDPDASFNPPVPNPCYVYKPGTDTWEQQAEVPIAILGSSLGSVSDGDTWKLVIASGLSLAGPTDATQIWTKNLSGGASTFQLTVNVNDGWNMVSVPGINPDGQGTTTWWSGLTGDVYQYSSGYTVVTTTTPGIGYWMKHGGAQTYNTGDEWPAGGIETVPHDPIAGVTGWNMIGGYDNSATVAGIITNPSGLVDGPVYGYNNGYTTPTTMDPGYGYWIKLSGDGDIILPNALAKGNEPIEWFKDDWGRITFTDATGKEFTLYAVNGNVNLNQYEMPPAPPQGMFDIRYASERIAEDINSSVQGIDLSGITYPLKVRVEKMDMRLQDATGKKLNENVKDGEEIVIADAQISKIMVSGELIPAVYALEQNYPNPFNPSTVIEFSLPEDVSNVQLSIYNVLGEKVAELVNGSLLAGRYRYQWNARNVATGMYIYELRTNKFVSVKKMLLLK